MKFEKRIYYRKFLEELEEIGFKGNIIFESEDGEFIKKGEILNLPKNKKNAIKAIIQNHDAEKAEQEYLAQEENDNKLLFHEAAILRALLEKAIDGTKIPEDIKELIKK